MISQTVQELLHCQTDTHTHTPTNRHYWIQYHLYYDIAAKVVIILEELQTILIN